MYKTNLPLFIMKLTWLHNDLVIFSTDAAKARTDSNELRSKGNIVVFPVDTPCSRKLLINLSPSSIFLQPFAKHNQYYRSIYYLIL